MSHALQGHPKQTDHSEEFQQNAVYWRREWQSTRYSCIENPMDSMKRQEAVTMEYEPPGQKLSSMY